LPLTLTIVTAEQTVLERNDVQRLIVPTMEGQITILPKHAALMAALESGEMIAHTSEGEVDLAVHGGFIQVAHDVVTVLADAAERVEDIDEERAEAARQRAQQRLAGQLPGEGPIDIGRAHAALRRATVRINIRRRRRTGAPSPAPPR